MKTILLSFFFLSFLQHLPAQSLDRFVIGSTGQHSTSASFELSSTIGEAVVGTQQGVFSLNQGFQQSDAGVSTSMDPKQYFVEYTLFPNPTRGPFSLRLKLEKPVELLCELLDLQGRSTSIPPQTLAKAQQQQMDMDLSGLPSGMYLLRILDRSGHLQQTLRVQKVD